MSKDFFHKGTLWERINVAFQRAVGCGALKQIQTELCFIEDAGVRFQVRIVLDASGKVEFDRAKERQTISREPAATRDPFCPYDERLFVAKVTPTHLCLLNKFTVIDNHILLVTSSFEDQENLLNYRDFAALLRCMVEFDGLGFYNGGREAGASQAHKHLQIVPMTFVTNESRLPIERLIDGAKQTGTYDQAILPDLPFRHLFTRFDGIDSTYSDKTATALAARYLLMMEALDLVRGERGNLRQTAPYNLLITNKWLLLIPRRRELFGDLSLNSLAFAGALLVRDLHGLSDVQQVGPMRVLRYVTFPRTDESRCAWYT